jgi:DNA-binding transcriptional LysR family regulator
MRRRKADRPNDPYALFAWDDVQYFLELVRKKTLIKASRRFDVSHTTVLRRIGNLERMLDQKLFKRTPQGFVLTEAGVEFLVHAEAMERAADQAIRSNPGKDKFSGPVRIAVVEGLAVRVLGPALAAFRDKYPEISVEVVTAMQTANLTRREADISIGIVRPTGPRHVARRIARCDVYLYASRDYIDRRGVPASLDEIDRHVFVDYITDMIEIPALKWLQDTVGERRVVFRSTSPLAQLDAVKRGIGMGMFPTYMADSEPTLRRVLEKEARTTREFWIAVHEELRSVPRMSAFFDFVREVLSSNPSFYR